MSDKFLAKSVTAIIIVIIAGLFIVYDDYKFVKLEKYNHKTDSLEMVISDYQKELSYKQYIIDTLKRRMSADYLLYIDRMSRSNSLLIDAQNVSFELSKTITDWENLYYDQVEYSHTLEEKLLEKSN